MRTRRVFLVFLLLVLAASSGSEGASAAVLEGVAVRVVDGDTIHVRLAGRVEKVRYIGVNTPEVHHPRKGVEPGGREAMEVNRQLAGGKRVRLEFDVRERDRYGRLLAYVWVCAAAARPAREGWEARPPEASDCPGTGQTMINAELVRLGYAQVMTVPPNVRYQDLFVKRERQARESGRGLWRGP